MESLRLLPLAAAALLAPALSGCIVPESMTALREELGYASVDPALVIVKARASTLAPRVNEQVTFQALVEGIEAATASITWDLDGVEARGPSAARAWDEAGPVEVLVTARAPTGETARDLLALTVRDNLPPAAAIVVEDRDGLVDGEITVLSAETSVDPDGDPLTFEWELDGAEPVPGARVERAFTAGVHRVRLTASDGLDEVVAFDAFGVRLPLAAAGHASYDAPVVELSFNVLPGASGLSARLLHTSLLGIDDVDLVLVDGAGREVAASVTGPELLASSANEALAAAAEELAPGAYTLEARLTRGAGADVTIEGVLTYSPLAAP